MSEFGTIDSQNTSYKSGRPHASIPVKKSSSLQGCLLIVLSIFLLMFLSFVMITGIIIYKSYSGSSDFIVSFDDETDTIHEKLVTRGPGNEKIAIIQVNGVIYRGNAVARDHSSSDSIILQIKKAAKDENVKVVILDMNTPGGGVTATDEIHHELLKLRGKGKKVVTCMRTVAASGGYYLAAGTDYIVANRLTITGSIGVIIGGYNYHGLFERLGVKSEVYKSGKLKDILNMGRAREDEEIKLIQEIVDETYIEFASIVAAGRNMDFDDVTNGIIGDGSIFSGKKAYTLGLVDELGFLEDAIKKAKELANANDASVVRYQSRLSLTDLFSSFKTDILSEILPGKPTIIHKGYLYYLCPLVL